MVFNDNEVNDIIFQYIELKSSCSDISKKYNISKLPITNLLKELNLLRKGYSNGKKLNLNETQKNEIKRLYLDEYKTSPHISSILNINKHSIDKFLHDNKLKRTVGESITLRQTGKKHTKQRKENFKKIQQEIASSGNRKQKGGICKFFKIDDLECQGTYEKFYIEKLIKEEKELPKNGKTIKTPYGVYTSDFYDGVNLIEIKSDYTYEILIGKKINRFNKKIDLRQFKKIKWVNKNIQPVEIIVVNKRNNVLIKKEIK